MGKKCLKCEYERTSVDSSPDYECPKCGAIYAKVEAALARASDKAEYTNPKLTNCKTCGREVSKSAKTCPHCGEKNPAPAQHGGCLSIAIAFVTILWVIGKLFGLNSGSDSSTYPKHDEFQAQVEGSGRYLSYNYTYIEKDGMIAASFRPLLPRDDTILIGAMLELVNNIYGKHQISDLKPSLVSRNDRNLIRFHGVGFDYFFLVIKQDTGEVNGVSMWREPA